MVDQTKVNTSNGYETPPRAVARSTAEFLHDILTLAELQGRLLVLDGQSELRKLIFPLVILVTGAVVCLSCLPIALAALALLLVEAAEFTLAQAFGIALLVGLALGGVLVMGGVFYLRSGWTLFERSRTEWQRNVQWAKDVLRRAGRRAPETIST
jgi:hypothetical protein